MILLRIVGFFVRMTIRMAFLLLLNPVVLGVLALAGFVLWHSRA